MGYTDDNSNELADVDMVRDGPMHAMSVKYTSPSGQALPVFP
jgi:hypothetical protein